MEITIFVLLCMVLFFVVSIGTAEDSTNKNHNEKLQHLYAQVESNYPENWLNVANSKFATETHLLDIAKKTAAIYYQIQKKEIMQLKIANALAENPTTTDAVMKELTKSSNPNVWKIVALSNRSGKSALIATAKNCATLDYDYLKEKQLEIANSLLENLATTDAVMKELTKSRNPDVWKIVALSNKSEEATLVDVAKKCSTLNLYCEKNDKYDEKAVEIANALDENPATTDSVMKELVKSRNPDVWKIVALSSKSKEATLLDVGEKCASLDYYYRGYSKDEAKQLEIANSLAKNLSTTKNVMTKLVKSNYKSVITIAHTWCENN